MRNISSDCVRNRAWLTTYFNLTHDLFEHSLLLFDSDRFPFEMQRYGDFDLLTLYESSQVGMYQASPNWIYLAVVKHDFTNTNAFHVNREDCVAARLRTQNGSQFA